MKRTVSKIVSLFPTFNWQTLSPIQKRCGHKKAIIAIARMLLTTLYNMLKNNEPYNAELYRKSDVIPLDREITVEQAILMAQFQGYKIKSAN